PQFNAKAQRGQAASRKRGQRSGTGVSPVFSGKNVARSETHGRDARATTLLEHFRRRRRSWEIALRSPVAAEVRRASNQFMISDLRFTILKMEPPYVGCYHSGCYHSKSFSRQH